MSAGKIIIRLWKCIIGTIVGFAIGVVFMLIGAMLVEHFYPIPANADFGNMQSFAAYRHIVPLAADLFRIGAYGIGALIGGGVATWVSERMIVPSVWVGMLLSALYIIDPVWAPVMFKETLYVLLPFSMLGYLLMREKKR